MKNCGGLIFSGFSTCLSSSQPSCVDSKYRLLPLQLPYLFTTDSAGTHPTPAHPHPFSPHLRHVKPSMSADQKRSWACKHGCMPDTAQMIGVFQAKGCSGSPGMAQPLSARLVKGLEGSAGFTTVPANKSAQFLLGAQELRKPPLFVNCGC